MGYYKRLDLSLNQLSGEYSLSWQELIDNEWKFRLFKGHSDAAAVPNIVSDILKDSVSAEKSMI